MSDHSSLLTNKNFLLYCAKHYDTTQCVNTEEFYEDLKRIKYIKKLFTAYQQTGQLKIRLVLNHLIILNNVFESTALARILFLKMESYAPFFVPFLILLNVLPDKLYNIHRDGSVINTDQIQLDEQIVRQLRDICAK